MKPERHLTNQRGVGMISTVIVMSALLAAIAVGVGLGRHMLVATEVQTIAEVAANAAATAKLTAGATDAAAISSAQTVVSKNKVDGNVIPSSSVPAPIIEIGNWTAPTFTAGGAPSNAARATASATVKDLIPITMGFAGGGGFSTQSDSNGKFTVTKKAIATFSSIGAGRPTLPIALGNCNFGCSGIGCTPPPLTQAPANANNSGWTAFTTSSPGTSSVVPLLPSGGGCGGGGQQAPLVAVADGGSCPSGAICSINMNGGQITPALQDLKCLFDNNVLQYGVTQFVVPIVNNGCAGNVNGTYPVIGFATLVIDLVVDQGGNKGLNLHSLVTGTVPGPPGGGNFGTGFVEMVG